MRFHQVLSPLAGGFAERLAEGLDRIDFSVYAREIERRFRAQRRRLEQVIV